MGQYDEPSFWNAASMQMSSFWVPFGFFMTGLQYLLTAIKNIIEPDIYLSTSVLEGYDDNEREV